MTDAKAELLPCPFDWAALRNAASVLSLRGSQREADAVHAAVTFLEAQATRAPSPPASGEVVRVEAALDALFASDAPVGLSWRATDGHVKQAFRAGMLKALQAAGVSGVPEGVVADAARWRALLAGDRMRIMGWAGFDKDGKPRDGMYLHFGMEFWTEHDAKADPACAADTARCRTILTGYADRLAAAPER